MIGETVDDVMSSLIIEVGSGLEGVSGCGRFGGFRWCAGLK